MKNVYLIPGFGASDLAILATGQKLWWDTSFAAVTGLGGLRLAANGVDPGPPDGVTIGVSTVPQEPWTSIRASLRASLDVSQWNVQVGPYDWRKDLQTAANSLATNIRTHSTPDEPATIVGHSAGGLVAVLAWASLVATGETAKVRRIISICSPFQGSYSPPQWLTGQSASILQLLSIYPLAVSAAPRFGVYWILNFLNELAFTWPSFYQLYPALGGTDAVDDPNRALLYTAANYPFPLNPSQNWLDFSKNTFQPLLSGATTKPPQWVMTCVVSSGLQTVYALGSGTIPLDLSRVNRATEGDSIVTVDSQTRPGAKIVTLTGAHASVPLGIAQSGLLAELITDPRGPISPPPPPVLIPEAIQANTNEPPKADKISPILCIGGG